MNRAIVSKPPNFIWRICSIWYRHMRVYTSNLISNALPPFLEPVLFFIGIGLGLGVYIDRIEIGSGVDVPFVSFVATGIMMTASMFTASFECTFGTFFRLQYDKVYNGLMSAPVTANNIIVGEIIWAGTKGFFFTIAVVIVTSLFGVFVNLNLLLVPLLGLLTGLMFAALGLFVTSLVKTINQFNFFFSGFLSPMFFFCGVIFPISNLPPVLRPFAEALPLTHPVRLSRALLLGIENQMLWWDIIYTFSFIIIFGFLAVAGLRKKFID